MAARTPTTVPELYRRHHGKLVSWLRSRVASVDEAEEIAQEAWLRLLQVDGIEDIEYVRAYLFRIAANLVLYGARRRTARERYDPQDLMIHHALATPDPGPDEVTYYDQLWGAVRRVLVDMPDRRRQAFERFVLAGRTSAQVAAEMNLSVKMIEKHVARARADYREAFEF